MHHLRKGNKGCSKNLNFLLVVKKCDALKDEIMLRKVFLKINTFLTMTTDQDIFAMIKEFCNVRD